MKNKAKIDWFVILFPSFILGSMTPGIIGLSKALGHNELVFIYLLIVNLLIPIRAIILYWDQIKEKFRR